MDILLGLIVFALCLGEKLMLEKVNLTPEDVDVRRILKIRIREQTSDIDNRLFVVHVPRNYIGLFMRLKDAFMRERG